MRSFSSQRNAIAVFGPKSKAASAHASNICDAKDIPYIDTFFDIETKRSILNLYPSHETLTLLFSDLLTAYDWTDFIIIYESPTWLSRLSSLVESYSNPQYSVKFFRLMRELTDEPNFRSILISVKRSSIKKIILQCSTNILSEVLNQMLQVSLLTSDHHLIIADLDAQTVDLNDYRHTESNITIFRIIDPQAEPVKEIQNYLVENKNSESEEEYESNQKEKAEEPEEPKEPEFYVIDTHTALIYDGIMVLAQAIEQLGPDQIKPESVLCEDETSNWSTGTTILNYMRSVSVKYRFTSIFSI